MLKRVNIHINEDNLIKLDEIVKKIHSITGGSWQRSLITRADLIRYALSNTFGFKFNYIHTHPDNIKSALKKALKKAS